MLKRDQVMIGFVDGHNLGLAIEIDVANREFAIRGELVFGFEHGKAFAAVAAINGSQMGIAAEAPDM